MRMTERTRESLTLSNVVETLALVLVVAAGLSYAAGWWPEGGDAQEPARAAPTERPSTPVREKGPPPEVVVRTASVTFPAGGEIGSYKSAFVSCRSGERVVGGGLDADSNVARGSRNLIVVRSRPGDVTGAAVPNGASRRSWYVQARRKVADVVTTVTVQVRCAS